MKTCFNRVCLLASGVVMSMVLLGCVIDRHDALLSATARLERSSDHFVTQLRHQGDDSRRDRLSRDAEALARYSRKLDADVREVPSRVTLNEDYRQVEDSYEILHRDLADEGYADQDRLVLEDFDRVTTAYHDVQSAMITYGKSADVRR